MRAFAITKATPLESCPSAFLTFHASQQPSAVCWHFAADGAQRPGGLFQGPPLKDGPRIQIRIELKGAPKRVDRVQVLA